MAGPDEDEKVAPQRSGVREFRGNMSGFLRQARKGSSHDEVLAEIHPPSKADRPRHQPGALRGKIHMAGDFGALPPDVIAAMESNEE